MEASLGLILVPVIITSNHEVCIATCKIALAQDPVAPVFLK